MRELVAAGRKPDAMVVMKQCKVEQAKYDEILKEHPEVKAQLEAGGGKAPAKEVKKVPV
jgi:hypothetical protein